MLLHRKRWLDWIIVVLSPLWAGILVEVLRWVNFADLNKYRGWQFDEIYCNREVLLQLDVVHAEYWHFPTLDAWITFTVSFLILGSTLVLIRDWAKEKHSLRKLALLSVAVFVLAALYTLYSLMSPRRLPNPFFELNMISLLLLSLWFIVQRRDDNNLSKYTLVRWAATVLSAYILGLGVGFLAYTILFNLGKLPIVAYC